MSYTARDSKKVDLFQREYLKPPSIDLIEVRGWSASPVCEIMVENTLHVISNIRITVNRVDLNKEELFIFVYTLFDLNGNLGLGLHKLFNDPEFNLKILW